MGFKDETSSRNGTLSINSQTTAQRNKFSLRFSGLGSGATSNSSALFPDSPIDNAANRSNPTDSSIDNQTLSVYDAYASVVDSGEAPVAGFGFSSSELSKISLDYRHESNPFPAGEYDALTKGTAAGVGHKKRFLGFPDLIPPDIDAPTATADTVVPDATLNKTANANYGSTTGAYRTKAAITSTKLGYFAIDGEGNQTDSANVETLGQYFKNTSSQST